MKIFKSLWLLFFAFFALVGCSTVKVGGGESAPVSGAAVSAGDGQKTASSGSGELHRCSKNYGRLAIEEQPMSQQTMMLFSQSGISSFSPMPLARHAAMQSGCFTLVDRGASFAMGEREREINGEMGGSKTRKTIPARWGMKVEVPQPTTSTGAGAGVAAAARFIPGLGGLFGVAAGAVAGSMSFTEAQVILTIVDLETSEIVASVTGTGKSSDLGIGAAFLGAGTFGAGGGSSKTPAMKVVAAGFVDAFNQLIPYMDNMATATLAPVAPVPKTEQVVPAKKVSLKKKT
ncbi:MAG TPA: hypothetical protein DCS23_01805 [Candidatus Yonathbacteria bacterium]|nr:hypothetical protein [Candidatus Yonathbacteria bacterium]